MNFVVRTHLIRKITYLNIVKISSLKLKLLKVEKVKMRLLGVMTSEQRLIVRTKLTKLSILGAILGPRTVTVSVSLGCSLLKELSRGFFCT